MTHPMPLAKPTIEEVVATSAEFDGDQSIALTESALRELISCFRANGRTSHVLLKVLSINQLYSARVLNKHLDDLSMHISSLDNLDAELAEGLPSAVERIANCPRVDKRYFSFATKYCSWHNLDAYPIYDGNVDECLWQYQRQDHFSVFKRSELLSYEKLYAIVDNFRKWYGLTAASYKQLDKYLWKQGDALIKGSATHPRN